MYKEELRLVEYTVTKKVEKKKSKKKENKKFKQIGLFHLWGRSEDKKGKESFFGLVEDLQSGDILEVVSKNIRFLSDDEVESLTEKEPEDEIEMETTEEISEKLD